MESISATTRTGSALNERREMKPADKYQLGKWYRIKLTEQPDSQLPWGINFPGVYLIFNNQNQCLYIGQSISIGKRLRTHIRLSIHSSLWQVSWRKKGYETLNIAFRRDKKRFERLSLEARLIYRLKPKYNSLGKILNNE